MISNRLFEPILNIVYETMPRDNLLNSACLEIFELIKREHVKPLIMHLVENYREKLEEIVYVDTFQNLILKYDQLMEPHPDMDHSFTSADTETPGRPNMPIANGLRWRQSLKEDAEEEAYFNGDDDDEEDDSLPEAVKPVANGASPVKAPLVPYPDDDEMDILSSEDGTLPSSQPVEEQSDQKSSPTLPGLSDPTISESAIPQTPPERISEKRRREEDEEDALGHLANQTKRRSSFGGASSGNESASPPQQQQPQPQPQPQPQQQPPQKQPLRRKSSIKSGKDGPRISIALTVKSSEGKAGQE